MLYGWEACGQAPDVRRRRRDHEDSEAKMWRQGGGEDKLVELAGATNAHLIRERSPPFEIYSQVKFSFCGVLRLSDQFS